MILKQKTSTACFPWNQKTNQRQKSSYQMKNKYNMYKKKMLILQSKTNRKIRQVVRTTQQPKASNTYQTTWLTN